MSGSRPAVVVITGGSRGIGAATAVQCAKAGYYVCVNFHSQTVHAEDLVHSIQGFGGKAIAVQADVAKEADVVRLFETVDRELGPVTALVANAGITGGLGRIDTITGDRLRAVFETNVFGAFWACREAVLRMSTARGRSGGNIVLVSSQAALTGGNQLSHYASSKAALNALVIGLAREVAGESIRVNAVSPGVIDTDQQRNVPADRQEILKASLPMKRLGTSNEVAEAILWLLSDRASYVSGAIVPVHGAR